MDIHVVLDPDVALFYTRVACLTGKPVSQVIRDALFLLAAELSLEALDPKDPQGAC